MNPHDGFLPRLRTASSSTPTPAASTRCGGDEDGCSTSASSPSCSKLPHLRPSPRHATTTTTTSSSSALVAPPQHHQHYDGMRVACLDRRRAQLEAEEKMDALLRDEGHTRAAINGGEHEGRFRLTWAFTRAAAELHRHQPQSLMHGDGDDVRTEAHHREEIRRFQAWGNLSADESAERAELVESEQQDHRFILSTMELYRAQAEERQQQRHVREAEARFDVFAQLRKREIAVAMKALHTPRANYAQQQQHHDNDDDDGCQQRKHIPCQPPHKYISSVIVTGVPDALATESAIKHTEYLMNYTVNTEEFEVRQQLRREEVLARLELSAVHLATKMMGEEEPDERRALMALMHLGAAPSRLTAIIKIQRWMRMTRQQPWSARRREAMARAVDARRVQLSADDLHARLARLERQDQHAKSKDDDGAVDALALRKHIISCKLELMSAAVRRYSYMLDYYIFTLTERVKSFMSAATYDAEQRLRDIVAHDVVIDDDDEEAALEEDVVEEAPIDEGCDEDTSQEAKEEQHVMMMMMEVNEEAQRLRQSAQDDVHLLQSWQVPHRIYRHHNLPYGVWRRTRWSLAAQTYINAVDHLTTEEEEARHTMEEREAHNTVGLEAFHAVLQQGPDAVEDHEEYIAHVHHVELSERCILAYLEIEERAELNIEGCRVSSLVETMLRPFLLLQHDEEDGRREVEAEASDALEHIVSDEWQWANLAQHRRRRLANRPSSPLARVLAQRGARMLMPSLDVAARIITFFMRRAQRRCDLDRLREETRLALASEPASPLKPLALEMRKQLQKLYADRAAASRADKIALIEAMDDDVGAELAEDDEEAAEEERMNAHVDGFASWFDGEAQQPRDQHYQDVLSRFHHVNEDFYHSLNYFLAILRSERCAIEEEEQRELYLMRGRQCYRQSMIFQVVRAEERRRRYAEAEVLDARDELLDDVVFMKNMLVWGSRAVQQAEGPSTAAPARISTATTSSSSSSSQSSIHEADSSTKNSLCPAIFRPLVYARAPTTSSTTTSTKPPSTCDDDDDDDGVQWCRPDRGPEVVEPERLLSYPHKGPSLNMILRGRIFPDENNNNKNKKKDDEESASLTSTQQRRQPPLPQLSDVERLVSREEVCRSKIDRQQLRATADLMLAAADPARRAVVMEEEQERATVCHRVDACFPDAPPIFSIRECILSEAAARARLEEAIWMSYSSPFLRAHHHLSVLWWPNFLLGHLAMDSSVAYMDRRLTRLLVERVSHVENKVDELMQHEAAVRQHITYMEETMRTMRFVLQKISF